MTDLADARRGPFAVAGVVLLVVGVAVARLPDSFVISLEENSPLTSSVQAGWAFRLLALAAIAQAFYGGFFVLREDRVKRSRDTDPKVAATAHRDLISSLARTGASMTNMTLLYGLAGLWATGLRGGFWLFPTVAVIQIAWYYRRTGEVARWLAFQPELQAEEIPDAVWRREPPDYCPPLARGMRDLPGRAPASRGDPGTALT